MSTERIRIISDEQYDTIDNIIYTPSFVVTEHTVRELHVRYRSNGLLHRIITFRPAIDEIYHFPKSEYVLVKTNYRFIVLNVASGKKCKTIHCDTCVAACAPDGLDFAYVSQFGDGVGAIAIHNRLENGPRLSIAEEQPNEVDLAFTDNGKHLMVRRADATVFFDTKTGAEVWRVPANTGAQTVYHNVLQARGSGAIVGWYRVFGQRYGLSMIDLVARKTLYTIEIPDQVVTGDLIGKGAYFITISPEKQFSVRHAKTGTRIRCQVFPVDDQLACARWIDHYPMFASQSDRIVSLCVTRTFCGSICCRPNSSSTWHCHCWRHTCRRTSSS